MNTLKQITTELSNAVDAIHFAPPVTHVYNPLTYAKIPHEQYLKRFGDSPKEAVWVGMNPGPFGMMQTGIPFGDTLMVRDFLGIHSDVPPPNKQHPKRRIEGFACPRSEVSGTRLWTYVKDKFNTPEAFFERFYVANYCPLVFLEESGRNRTPDKLPPNERQQLFEVCDKALNETVHLLGATTVIGIGAFAFNRIKRIFNNTDITLGTILHPSPASPAANRGWAEAVEQQLKELGVL